MTAEDVGGWQDPGSHLVPGVGPVGRVGQHRKDLGPGQQRSCSLGCSFRVEVVGALLKHEVRGGVGREGEEVHVPEEHGHMLPSRVDTAVLVPPDHTTVARGCVCVCV